MKRFAMKVLVPAAIGLTFTTGAIAASSPASTTVTVVTLANTPANLTMDVAKATDTMLPLSWEANGNPANTAYTLEFSTDSTTYQILQDKTVDDLGESVNNLLGNTRYYFRVSSYNQDSPLKTNGGYLTGSFLTKPSKPSVPTGSLVDGVITLNWSNVAGTTTKLFDGSDRQVTIPDEAVTTTVTDTDPDTKYEYYVVQSNETGGSIPSDKLTLWTDANPPANLVVTDRTKDSLKVAIDANGNPSTTQYLYTLTKKDGTSVASSEWLSDLTYEFTGLVAGEYKVQVRAKNNQLNPIQKETSPVELLTGTIPIVPTIDVTASEDSLKVEMTPGSSVDGVEFAITLLDEIGLEVATTGWAKSGEGWASAGYDYTFANLEPNHKYQVKAEARYAQ